MSSVPCKACGGSVYASSSALLAEAMRLHRDNCVGARRLLVDWPDPLRNAKKREAEARRRPL